MWYRGRINSQVRYEAKVYDGGSEFGIDGGRISKLRVTRNGIEIVWYERGWLIRPVDGEDLQILEHILKKYN